MGLAGFLFIFFKEIYKMAKEIYWYSIASKSEMNSLEGSIRTLFSEICGIQPNKIQKTEEGYFNAKNEARIKYASLTKEQSKEKDIQMANEVLAQLKVRFNQLKTNVKPAIRQYTYDQVDNIFDYLEYAYSYNFSTTTKNAYRCLVFKPKLMIREQDKTQKDSKPENGLAYGGELIIGVDGLDGLKNLKQYAKSFIKNITDNIVSIEYQMRPIKKGRAKAAQYQVNGVKLDSTIVYLFDYEHDMVTPYFLGQLGNTSSPVSKIDIEKVADRQNFDNTPEPPLPSHIFIPACDKSRVLKEDATPKYSGSTIYFLFITKEDKKGYFSEIVHAANTIVNINRLNAQVVGLYWTAGVEFKKPTKTDRVVILGTNDQAEVFYGDFYNIPDPANGLPTTPYGLTKSNLSYVYIEEFNAMDSFVMYGEPIFTNTKEDQIEGQANKKKYYTSKTEKIYDRSCHVARTSLHEMCHQLVSERTLWKANHSNEGETNTQYDIEKIKKLNDASLGEHEHLYHFKLLFDWGFVLLEERKDNLLKKGGSISNPPFPLASTNSDCLRLLSIDLFIVSTFFLYGLFMEEIMNIVSAKTNYKLPPAEGRKLFLRKLFSIAPLPIKVKDNYLQGKKI
jgi:hypothetical protein